MLQYSKIPIQEVVFINSGLIKVLQSCPLFKEMNEDLLIEAFASVSYRIVEQGKGSFLAVEGDECNALGFVIEGKVEVQKVHVSGKMVTLTNLGTGDMFGEAIIFSSHKQYPATIMCLKPVKILLIKGQDVISLCSTYPRVLQNFMTHLSNRILMLNSKIQYLSLETIRQKIVIFLWEQYKKEGSILIKIPLTKQKLAEQMGVQRPSLSREMGKLRDEGYIDFSQNQIRIINLEGLIRLIQRD